jgi:hypothetical protein
LKDKVEGFGWVAVVKLEEVCEGFALLEGNDGEQGIACERQIESSPWSSMSAATHLHGLCSTDLAGGSCAVIGGTSIAHRIARMLRESGLSQSFFGRLCSR